MIAGKIMTVDDDEWHKTYFCRKNYYKNTSKKCPRLKLSNLQSNNLFKLTLSCWGWKEKKNMFICVGRFRLTLILLEPKVISFCHQYRARRVWLGCILLASYLEIPKTNNGKSQNGSWTSPFNKFSRLRLNLYQNCMMMLQYVAITKIYLYNHGIRQKETTASLYLNHFCMVML